MNLDFAIVVFGIRSSRKLNFDVTNLNFDSAIGPQGNWSVHRVRLLFFGVLHHFSEHKHFFGFLHLNSVELDVFGWCVIFHCSELDVQLRRGLKYLYWCFSTETYLRNFLLLRQLFLVKTSSLMKSVVILLLVKYRRILLTICLSFAHHPSLGETLCRGSRCRNRFLRLWSYDQHLGSSSRIDSEEDAIELIPGSTCIDATLCEVRPSNCSLGS